MEQGIIRNFDTLCRLCLVSGVELNHIFKENNNTNTNFGIRYTDKPLAIKIESCTSLTVSEDDQLPNSICKTCTLKVTRAFEFRQQCKRSDEILRRYIIKKIPEVSSKPIQDLSQRIREGEEQYVHEIATQQLQEVLQSKNKLKTSIKAEPQSPPATAVSAEDHEIDNIIIKEEVCDDVYKTEENDEDDGEMVMAVDPIISMMNEEDNTVEEITDINEMPRMLDGSIYGPTWMNNSHEDEVCEEWRCQHCNISFDTEIKYSRHSLIHTSEPPFPCDYCDEKFELRTDLKSHWKVHSDGNPHICQMCGQSFPDRVTHLKHTELHDQVKPFRCPVCEKSFCYGSDLRKHLVAHTGVRPYVCSVCGTSFTRSTSLNKHLRMHNGNKPFACSFCPKIFGSRGDLKRHQIIHSGIKPWICAVCNVPFNRKDKLVRHEKLHSGEPRPFQCFECPTSFSRKEDLTKHIQFHHYKPPFSLLRKLLPETDQMDDKDDEELIECNTLEQIHKFDIDRGNQFSKQLANDTFNGNHNNGESAKMVVEESKEEVVEIIYKCNICHKKFPNQDTLETHQKIHTAIKPFACSMCDKSFYRRRELTRHEAVHTGFKPFSCGVCGKSFSRTDKLNRHVQTHEYKTVIRNFSCNDCNANFRNEIDLQNHTVLCTQKKDNNDVMMMDTKNHMESLIQNDNMMVITPSSITKSQNKTSQETIHKLSINPEIDLLPIM